jgi:hypothetical protein
MGLAQIVADLKDTTLGRTLAKELLGANDRKRAALAGEREKLQASADRELVPLVAARKAALDRVVAAGAELEQLQREAIEADQALSGAVHALEARERRLERELSELAPEDLRHFHRFLGRLQDELQKHPAPWGAERPAILELLGATREARADADGLELSGVPAAKLRETLDGRVEALRASTNGLSRAIDATVWKWRG